MKRPMALDEDLLLLKATSHAALFSMEEALSALQDYRETRLLATSSSVPNPVRTSKHGGGVTSPKKSASNFFALNTPTKPSSTPPGKTSSPVPMTPTSYLPSSNAPSLYQSTTSLPADLKKSADSDAALGS